MWSWLRPHPVLLTISLVVVMAWFSSLWGYLDKLCTCGGRYHYFGLHPATLVLVGLTGLLAMAWWSVQRSERNTQ